MIGLEAIQVFRALSKFSDFFIVHYQQKRLPLQPFLLSKLTSPYLFKG